MSTSNEPIIRRSDDGDRIDRTVVKERARVVDRPVVRNERVVVDRPVVRNERVVERVPVVQHKTEMINKPPKKHFSKKWLALAGLLLLGYLLSSLIPSHIFSSKLHRPVEHHEDVRVETDYKSAPHRFETESWRETEPVHWSPKQATGWFKYVLPSYFHRTPTARTEVVHDYDVDRKTQDLIDRFERSGITGTMLAEFLKRGVVDKDNDMFRQLLKIEEHGLSDYLMAELRKFTPTSLHTKTTDHHRVSHHSDHHGMWGFLTFLPLKIFGKTLETFFKTVLTVFELGGLLLIGMSLLSPIDSQKSLLRSTSMIFDDILLSFFGIFNKHITPKSATSTTSSGEAVKPHSGLYSFLKYSIGGPISLILGPFLYLATFFYTISRSIMHRISSLALPVIGLFVFKMLAPSWLWNPVSFVLWHVVGGYGAITLLLRCYRSIFNMLMNRDMRTGVYSNKQRKVASSYVPPASDMYNERVINPATSSSISSTPISSTTTTTPITGYGVDTASTAFPKPLDTSSTRFPSNIDNIDNSSSIVHRSTVMEGGDMREKERDLRGGDREGISSVIKRNYLSSGPETTTSAGSSVNRVGTTGA